MKFQLAINLERLDDSDDMQEVARHTLEMVQMADQGGFNIVWAAEHHAIEMTIAPDPFQLLAWWGRIHRTSGLARRWSMPPIGIQSSWPVRRQWLI